MKADVCRRVFYSSLWAVLLVCGCSPDGKAEPLGADIPLVDEDSEISFAKDGESSGIVYPPGSDSTTAGGADSMGATSLSSTDSQQSSIAPSDAPRATPSVSPAQSSAVASVNPALASPDLPAGRQGEQKVAPQRDLTRVAAVVEPVGHSAPAPVDTPPVDSGVQGTHGEASAAASQPTAQSTVEAVPLVAAGALVAAAVVKANDSADLGKGESVTGVEQEKKEESPSRAIERQVVQVQQESLSDRLGDRGALRTPKPEGDSVVRSTESTPPSTPAPTSDPCLLRPKLEQQELALKSLQDSLLTLSGMVRDLQGALDTHHKECMKGKKQLLSTVIPFFPPRLALRVGGGVGYYLGLPEWLNCPFSPDRAFWWGGLDVGYRISTGGKDNFTVLALYARTGAYSSEGIAMLLADEAIELTPAKTLTLFYELEGGARFGEYLQASGGIGWQTVVTQVSPRIQRDMKRYFIGTFGLNIPLWKHVNWDITASFLYGGAFQEVTLRAMTGLQIRFTGGHW